MNEKIHTYAVARISFFVIFILSLVIFVPSVTNAATGDILYQNCASGGSCTGAGSNNGWTRSVVSSGCKSGNCLKLAGTLNSNNGEFGAGNTSLPIGGAISGHDEITVSTWMKFSKTNISNANFKWIRPYVGGEYYWAAVVIPIKPAGGDFYISPVDAIVEPASWFSMTTYTNNHDYPINNGDGTYITTTGRTKGNFTSSAPGQIGTTWMNLTQWIKLPSTNGADDGAIKIWLNGELFLNMYNCGYRNTESGTTFSGLNFFPSSEAHEPFEHWMDEMVIYEGYVPPDGSSAPTPTPDTPTTSCDQYDRNSAIPSGYGAPYNLFSTSKETTLKANCNAGSVLAEVGSGSQNQYIYNRGYVWKNGDWQSITFSGSDRQYTNWYRGSAVANIALTDSEQENGTFYAAYICNWTGTEWKCGCRDTTCTTNYWQLQMFQR